jgi:hypothetical protein
VHNSSTLCALIGVEHVVWALRPTSGFGGILHPVSEAKGLEDGPDKLIFSLGFISYFEEAFLVLVELEQPLP